MTLRVATADLIPLESIRPESQVWIEPHPRFLGHYIVESEIPDFKDQFKNFLGPWGLLKDVTKLHTLEAAVDELGYETILIGDIEKDAQQELDNHKLSVRGFHPNELSPQTGTGLYDFQVVGINRALQRHSILLNWPVGAGKTIGAAVIAQALKERGESDIAVVFCTQSKKFDWKRDLETFTDLKCEIVDGNRDARERQYRDSSADVLIMNYEKARYEPPSVLADKREAALEKGKTYIEIADYSLIHKGLSGRRVVFIYDEVQKIRVRSNLAHQGVQRLVKKLNVVQLVALSATPIERGPVDYYNLFRILAPKVFKTVDNWERDFTVWEGGANKDEWGSYLGYRNLKTMKYMSDYYVHRVDLDNSEISELFPKIRVIEDNIKLSTEDRQLYNLVLGIVRGEYASQSKSENLARLHLLRQICNTPESLLHSNAQLAIRMRDDPKVAPYLNSKHSNKVNNLLDEVDEIISQNSKIVIFTQWVTTLKVLARALDKKGIRYTFKHGGRSSIANDKAEREFKTRPYIHVFLSTDAGAEGANLQESCYLKQFDLPWKWSTFQQRAGRIRRLSSKFTTVTTSYFLTKNTVEEHVWEVIQGKRLLASALEMSTDEDVKTLDKLTKEELQEVLFK